LSYIESIEFALEAFPLTDARTKFIDYDARRDPKTSVWCCMCQRDLNPAKPMRHVYVCDQMCAIHPEDLAARPADPSDYGWLLIGVDCAKKLGLEWSLPERPTA
jgi:hypothetical protein